MPRFLTATLILLVLVQFTRAGDWRQFRGPGGQGISLEKNLATQWSDDENIEWKTKLPGYGASSPICLGDRLYVTCYSGYGMDRSDPGSMDDLRLHVTCVDRNSGDILWDKKIRPKLPESERVRDHGYAAATPATDGESLYVFFGKSGVFRFDLNGEQIWNTEVGSRTHGWGCGTSPVLYEDLVIVNASVESRSLVAINKETGEEVWRQPGMRKSWNTPHLVNLPGGGTELVVSVEGKILAFDPRSGEPLWNCDGIPDYVCPSIISRDGIVYAIGGRTSRAIAVRAGGRGDVTESHGVWVAKAGANVSSPVIHGDHMYWVSDRNRIAYCLRLSDGEIVYSKRFRGQPYASTLLADDKLYVVTRYSGTFVLAAQPQFKQIAHNELRDDTTFNASPIAVGGSLILRSDQYLYSIAK